MLRPMRSSFAVKALPSPGLGGQLRVSQPRRHWHRALILVLEAVPCIAGWLTAALASTHPVREHSPRGTDTDVSRRCQVSPEEHSAPS